MLKQLEISKQSFTASISSEVPSSVFAASLQPEPAEACLAVSFPSLIYRDVVHVFGGSNDELPVRELAKQVLDRCGLPRVLRSND